MRGLTTLCLGTLIVSWLAVPAPTAEMDYPLGIVATDNGTIYVADKNRPGIWEISDGKAKLFYEGSAKFRTPFNAVYCLALDHQGRLLAGDSATREVYRFDKQGQPQPLTEGRIGIPVALAVNDKGTIFVSDLETQRIWSIPAEGGKPTEFAQLAAVRGLAFDEDGNLLVVTTLADPIRRFSPEGQMEVVVEGRPFKFPHQLVLDEDGTAYVTDNYARAIWKVEPGKEPSQWVQGKPLVRPVGLARRGKQLLVSDPHTQKVFAVDQDGQLKPVVK